ncbi:MAG TPA: anti-sigma factor [Solirubrobacteraceae bacterium]|jgi:hypothetical protein
MSDEQLRSGESPSCGDAPLYVLGLLDDEQSADFFAHAQSCVVCRDEAAALRPAVDLLGESVQPLQMPAALRASVLDAVEAEASISASASALELRDTRWRLRKPLLPKQRLRPLVLTAGTCALIAAGGALGVSLFGSSSPSTTSFKAAVSLPNATATLHRSGSHFWLTVAHMPSPGKGRVYEVWLKRSGRAPAPTSALFEPTARGAGQIVVPGDLKGVSEVMVTSEPEGGSLAPTRQPVIVARVS